MEELKNHFTFTDEDGKTYTGEVAIEYGLDYNTIRTQMSLAKDERRSADVATAKGLRARRLQFK